MRGARAGLVVTLAAGATMAAMAAAAAVGVRWEQRLTDYPGSANAVAVDRDGNAYVGGTVRWGSAASANLARYSRWGNRDLSTSWGGTSTVSEDSIRAVAIYPVSGTTYDIIVGGVRWSATTGQDAWVARLRPQGLSFNTVWEAKLDAGGTGGSDGVSGVAVTPAGDIVVAGWAAATGGAGDIWVARFAGNNPVPADTTTFPDILGVDDAALAIASDASGSLYVGGYLTTAGEGRNAWLAQYPAAGSLGLPLWTLTLNGANSATDFFRGVDVDDARHAVYAVGAEAGVPGWLDILVARATLDGGLVWTRTIDGGEQDNDEADACVVAPDGDLLATGSIDPPTATFSDIWVARFDPDGVLRWSFYRDGPDNYVDGGRGIAVDAWGGIRVAGVETDAQAVPRFYVGSLTEVAVSADVAGPATPRATPNPFRPGRGGAFDAAGISLRALPAGATVRIYTLAGERVVELRDTDRNGLIFWDAKNAGGKNVSSGVYLFVVDSGSGAITRGKVVIIR